MEGEAPSEPVDPSTKGIGSFACPIRSAHSIFLPLINARRMDGAYFRFFRLLYSILWGRIGFERTKKTSRDRGDFIDCRQEGGFVCLRRFIETADFSHGIDRGIEVKQGFDVPAHTVVRCQFLIVQLSVVGCGRWYQNSMKGELATNWKIGKRKTGDALLPGRLFRTV
jgi:hypothetical protein